MPWREAKTAAERKAALAEALTETGGSVSAAARLLGVDRKHLHRLIAPPDDKGPSPVVRIAVDMPRPVKEWLERKALERKQRGELRRMAMSPIVVELIEREMGAGSGRGGRLTSTKGRRTETERAPA